MERFVDDVKSATGANCTLFQKLNSAGDMLRVATTVTTADGKRATGTFIAHTNADGSANRVLNAIEKGETFIGRARVADAFSVTAYTPLRDNAGAIIGMLFVGIPEADATDRVRKLMMETPQCQRPHPRPLPCLTKRKTGRREHPRSQIRRRPPDYSGDCKPRPHPGRRPVRQNSLPLAQRR
jgi:hypothetical protein